MNSLILNRLSIFKLVFVLLLLIPFYSNAQWAQVGLDIDGEDSLDQSGLSVSMNSVGDRMAIGASHNDGSGVDAGHVRIYEWDSTTWVQMGLDIDGEVANDWSGSSVSINGAGDRLAIGAYLNDGNGTNSGHVRIYEWSGIAWTQMGADIDGEAAINYSGSSVSMNKAGDRVAIGATGNRSYRGHVRIYEWNGTAWTQLGTDIDGETAGDGSGSSVSINAAGDRLAIGAVLNADTDPNAGHTRVYKWDSTAWVQMGADLDGEARGDFSGGSVSINAAGDRLAIGAYYNDGNGVDAGHVRIYEWDSTAWVQMGFDIDGEVAGDYSGSSISMNEAGDRLAIGASSNDDNGHNAGHVRIYEWNSIAWIQLREDIDGEAIGDSSGWFVSMNGIGNRLAIGAPFNDGSGVDAGHVRVFDFPPCKMTVSITAQTNVTCNGGNNGSITVSVDSGTANYSYHWSDSSATISASDTFNTIIGLAAGQYFVTITDTNNCTAIDSANISEPPALTVSINVDSLPSGFGLSDGGLTANASGGTPLYTYLWSVTAVTPKITGLAAGTYSVSVSDSNNCLVVVSASLTEPDLLTCSTNVVNTSCSAGSDGSSTIAPAGGVTPYTYLWSNSDTTATIDSLTAGTYTVTLTDNNGITTTCYGVITSPTSILDSLTAIDVSCNGLANGSITTSTSGGTSPYTYLWNTFANTSSISSLVAASYTVTITDANSCSITDSAVIIVLDTSMAIRDSLIASACGNYTWIQNNQTYSSSGQYNDTLLNTYGCDSVYLYLDLTINPLSSSIDSIVACDSIIWRDGITYLSTNNSATDTLINSLGCDSIITLSLTINNTTRSIDTIVACDSIVWRDGITYFSTNNIAIDSIISSLGCDSIVTLNLTILNLDLTVVNAGDSLYALQASNSYQWIDCGNGDTLITGATNKGFKPGIAGDFAAIINNGACFDTSVCNLVRFVGLKKIIDEIDFKLFPNPASENITIESWNSIGEIAQITSITGAILLEFKITQAKETIDLSGFENGVYFLKVGNQTRKIIVAR